MHCNFNEFRLVAATANAAKVVMLTPLAHAGGADASSVNIAPLSQQFEEQQLQTWVQLVSCCALTFLQGETIAYLAALVLHLAILISVVSPMWKRPTLHPVLLTLSASIMCSTVAAVGSISTPAHAVAWLLVLVLSPFVLLVVWDKNLLKRGFELQLLIRIFGAVLSCATLGDHIAAIRGVAIYFLFHIAVPMVIECNEGH